MALVAGLAAFDLAAADRVGVDAHAEMLELESRLSSVSPQELALYEQLFDELAVEHGILTGVRPAGVPLQFTMSARSASWSAAAAPSDLSLRPARRGSPLGRAVAPPFC